MEEKQGFIMHVSGDVQWNIIQTLTTAAEVSIQK